MHDFTEQRDANTPDEIWFVQHQPVYTQGTAGKAENLLRANGIAVIQSDRGGQITYHGPGQQIMYLLLDVKRLHIGVRALVSIMEKTVINTLADYQLAAYAKADAPGVYLKQAKIASLGLRIRRGCSFHGIALNVTMDLKPFQDINPCGYANQAITQLYDWLTEDQYPTEEQVCQQLLQHFCQQLPYSPTFYSNKLP